MDPTNIHPFLTRRTRACTQMKSFQTGQLARGATEYRTIVHQQNYVSLLRAIGALIQDRMSGNLEAKLECAQNGDPAMKAIRSRVRGTEAQV
eukprot:11269337-Karenia_brevis.AAC.1